MLHYSRSKILILLFGVIIIFPKNTYSQSDVDSLLSYTHGSITLSYPALWHRDSRGSSLMLYPEKKDGHYPGDFSISFLSESVSPSTDIQSYKNHHLQSATSIWKRYGETLDIMETDTLMIAGLPAFKVLCRQEPAHQMRIKYMFIRNNRAYRLDYTGPFDTYKSYLNQVEEMVKSITINK